MTRSFVAFALSTALVACSIASPRRPTYGNYGSSSPQPAPGQASGTPAGTASPPAAGGDPRTQLTSLDQGLRRIGYAPVGPAVHGNLTANGLIAYAIMAQPGFCYAVAAIGAPAVDLNLTVLDAWGRTIDFNSQPASSAWATVCPNYGGRVIVRVQMARGGGEYYYTVYQGPMAQRPNLAAFFGGQADTVQTAQLDPATAQRLAALDARQQEAGYRRVGDPTGMVLEERQARDFQLNLDQSQCYAFATLGGQGARDTDVFVLDGAGEELRTDASTAIDGLVDHCPTQTGVYRLRVRMYSGSGALFTAVYQRPQNAGAAVSPTTVPATVISTTTTAAATLEDNYRHLDSDIRARGYEPFGEAVRGELASGQSREFDISLEGEKCYAILAVGDGGVRDLNLVLQTQGGQAVDRDTDAHARPIVRVCPQSSGAFRMSVQMAQGAGNFVYAAYRWPRGTRGPFGLRGLMYVRLAEVTQLLQVDGYAPDADFTPDRGTLRSQGASATEDLTLPAGQCYSIVVVGDQGIHDLDATLSLNGTQLAADGSINAFPNVRHCTTAAGRYRLAVRAAAGSGAYFYQVFRQGSLN